PFKVHGAVAQAVGTGTRNLYVVEDAYLFVFLQHLQDLGLSVTALQRIVDNFNYRFANKPPQSVHYFDPQNSWIVVSLTKHVLLIATFPTLESPPNPRLGPQLQLNDFHDRSALQVAVNIAKIRAEVDERLTTISNTKQTANRKQIESPLTMKRGSNDTAK